MPKCEDCLHKNVCVDSANYRSAESCRQYIDADKVTGIKSGHWEQVDETKCKCSECEAIAMIAQYPPGADKNFCPNCGARMDRTKAVDCVECRFYDSEREYCRKYEKAVFPFCFCFYGEERDRKIIPAEEYIEREQAEKIIDRFAGYLDDDMIYRIKYAIRKHIPAIDGITIVRCKDCIHSRVNPFSYNRNIMTCQFWQDRSHQGTAIVMKHNDFCSYGERRKAENE